MSWLDPVRQALDDSPSPCRVFFRVDDAGWDDERLFAMLDRFARHSLPVDVAVIPAALNAGLVHELTMRCRQSGVRLHQHGYAHVNHEPTGRKCEFGPSRALVEQAADVAAGRQLMLDAFGEMVDPVFTPPWNRCVIDTGEILADQGFRILSRDMTAPLLDRSDLLEIPITIDWFGQRKGVRWTREQLAGRIADGVTNAAPLGVMFHHAVTDEAELSAVDALLALVGSRPHTTSTTLSALGQLTGQGLDDTSG
jgi:predicted deacetylase